MSKPPPPPLPAEYARQLMAVDEDYWRTQIGAWWTWMERRTAEQAAERITVRIPLGDTGVHLAKVHDADGRRVLVLEGTRAEQVELLRLFSDGVGRAVLE